jgi:hypothetical protein
VVLPIGPLAPAVVPAILLDSTTDSNAGVAAKVAAHQAWSRRSSAGPPAK